MGNSGFRHLGTYTKKPTRFGGFFGYTHLKNPHFYFNLILVYTLYTTNNAIFDCFKTFKALSYWVFVLFYLFFLLVQKNPLGWAFFKKRVFLNPGEIIRIVLVFSPLSLLPPLSEQPVQNGTVQTVNRGDIQWHVFSDCWRRVCL